MGSQEGQTTAVEIDAASTDHLDPDTVDKPEDDVPWEPWKTVQAFVFFVCGSVLLFSMTFVFRPLFVFFVGGLLNVTLHFD